MRALFGLVIPLVIQIFAYLIVFAASRGGGSFMGLLAMPVAAISLIALLAVGMDNLQSRRPLSGVISTSLAIAVIPPILLLIVRALEG